MHKDHQTIIHVILGEARNRHTRTTRQLQLAIGNVRCGIGNVGGRIIRVRTRQHRTINRSRTALQNCTRVGHRQLRRIVHWRHSDIKCIGGQRGIAVRQGEIEAI